MKRFLILILLAVFFLEPRSYAEDKKSTALASGGQGGMTYSPTEGWIKTGANQMQVGTDSMEFFNRKKAEEEQKKLYLDSLAKKKADEEAALKLKAEQEAKLAQAEAIIKANEAKQNKGKKKSAQVDASGQKLPPKRRVLVS